MGITAALDVVRTPAWSEGAANAGQNSYLAGWRAARPLRLEAVLGVPPGDAIFRAQVIPHAAGGNYSAFIVRGRVGGYDDPWKTSPHAPPYTTELRALPGLELEASAGSASTWSATFEGPWAACWPHPTLAGYTICRLLDGGDVGVSVQQTASAPTGYRLAVGQIGRYAEEVGYTIASRALKLMGSYNLRSWHGGTAVFVQTHGLPGVPTPAAGITYVSGAPWQAGQNGEPDRVDTVSEGGFAISESLGLLVATMNWDDARGRSNDFSVWRVNQRSRLVSAAGTRWTAPAVSPDGLAAFAVDRGSNRLVRIDLARVAAGDLDSAVTWVTFDAPPNTAWMDAPVVTPTTVLFIVQGEASEDGVAGDVVAFDPTTLAVRWQRALRVGWNLNLLSGWRRADIHRVACGDDECVVASAAGFRLIRQSDGQDAFGPDKFLVPADGGGGDGYSGVQLFFAAGAPMVLAVNDRRELAFPPCQATMCSDGKPPGAVDFDRCCRGTTLKCPTARSEAECEQQTGIGWDDAPRFQLLGSNRAVVMSAGGTEQERRR